MFVPTVAGSDGTVVSVATGQNEYHPLYLSIGNVHNQVRRARRGALILIGFLAIPKSKFVLVFLGYVTDTRTAGVAHRNGPVIFGQKTQGNLGV